MRAPPRKTLWVVLAVGLLVRIAWIPVHRFSADRIETFDSVDYLDLAGSLQRTGRFERSVGRDVAIENPLRPEVFRTPGYPLLLAMLGHLPGSLLVWIVCVQILLGVGTLFAVWKLAAAAFGPREGLAAASLLAIDLPHATYSNLVMSDVLFSFALAVAVSVAFASAARRSASGALFSGVLFSVASAVRPVGLLAWIPTGFLLARRGFPRWSVALSGLLAFAFPFGWSLRNREVSGARVTSTAFDYNLVLVFAPRVRAARTGSSREEAQKELLARLEAGIAGKSLDERLGEMRRLAVEECAASPSATLRAIVEAGGELLLAGERGSVFRLFGESDVDAKRSRCGAVLAAIQIAWNLLLAVVAVSGTIRASKNGLSLEAAVLGATALLVLAPSLVVGNGRLRLPAAPLIDVLAGVAIAALVTRRDLCQNRAPSCSLDLSVNRGSRENGEGARESRP